MSVFRPLPAAGLAVGAVLVATVPASASILSLEGDTAARLMDEVVSPNGDVLLAALQDEEAAPPADESDWKGKFRAGFAGSFGNTDTQSAFASAEGIREKDDQRTTLSAGYYYGASNGDRDDNKLESLARHEWLMPESPWSIFAELQFDYDEFQSWEYRLGAYAGFGYELMREEDFELDGRVGAGAIKEFNSPNDDVRGELLLALVARWQISEKQSLNASTTWYPSLSDGGEFRTVNRADWSVVLDEEMNLSLAAGVRHEYQSEREPGVKADDVKITVGLQFDF